MSSSAGQDSPELSQRRQTASAPPSPAPQARSPLRSAQEKLAAKAKALRRGLSTENLSQKAKEVSELMNLPPYIKMMDRVYAIPSMPNACSAEQPAGPSSPAYSSSASLRSALPDETNATRSLLVVFRPHPPAPNASAVARPAHSPPPVPLGSVPKCDRTSAFMCFSLTPLLRAGRKWHYFMLDFCYYCQTLLLTYIFFHHDNALLFQVVFCMTYEPPVRALNRRRALTARPGTARSAWPSSRGRTRWHAPRPLSSLGGLCR